MPVENQDAPETPVTPAAASSHEDAFSQALATSQAGSSGEAAASSGGQAATPTQAVPAAQPGFRDLFKDSGLKLDQFKSDEEFRDAILNERRQMQQYARLGQQYAPHAADFDKYLTSQKQTPAPAAAAAQTDPNAWDQKKHFADQWKVPAWNKQWDWLIKNNLVEIDDRGLYSPANGAEAIAAPHLAAMNEHRQLHSEQTQQLFRGNPFESMYEAMLPAFERRVQAMFDDGYGQRQGEMQSQTALEQWETKHSAALYTQDTAGNPVFTPAGEKLMAEAQALMNEGLSDPVRALERAAAITGFQAPPAQQVIPPTPAQVSQQKQESFIDAAKKRAAHSTSSSAYSPTNTPNAPLVTDESELDSMFSNALARS